MERAEISLSDQYPKPWISGAPIPDLKQGWALLCFAGSRGHYWKEDTTTMEPTIAEGGRVRYYRAACGLVGLTRPKAPAMGVGSWPRCRRCESRIRQRVALVGVE